MLTIREAIPLIERAYPECQRRGRATDDCPSAVSTSDEDEWDEDLIVEFNPHITVLLRACQKARPALSWYLLDRAAASEAPVRKALDQLVAFVRRVCRSHKFKRLEMNFTRNEKANFRDYCKFMASKFEEHSRLLISRVDLYITPVGGRWMSRATSNRCMRRFLRALREGRIVPGVKAWICKRERGFRRGIHCHLLVAMDGHEHQKAGHYAQLLGEAWEQRFSDQCGSYFNCWARRYDYPLNCLGSVHIRDRKMLMGLREAIRYLTKESCQMRTGFARNLFRSQSSWSKGARKRGAPRKAEHDMTLVNEILGFA